MRLYAFLPLALFALAVHAATIPEGVVEKKIDIVSEDTNKIPDNTSSDQELIEQPNINDLDNKLRTKPAEIPVEVENVQQNSDDSDEIVRPEVDLRNTGPPQRQEHETQNPQFSSEQAFVQTYKQNLNNAHVFLKQGFNGVGDGWVQNLIQNNGQLKVIHDSISNLRDGFIAQINKLNGTVQNYLNAENDIGSVSEQTKANIKTIETGLKAIKEDFTRGVNTLSNGVDVLSSVKAEQGTTSGATAASGNPPPAASNPLFDFISGFQQNVQTGIAEMTNNFQNFISGNRPITEKPQNPQAGVQADTPASSQLPIGGFGSGFTPLTQAFTAFQQLFSQYFPLNFQNINTSANTPSQTVKPPEGNPSAQTVVVQQDEQITVNQATPAVTQAPPVVAQPGPIAQLLQNNPITQGINAAVQRFQNSNKPTKPDTPREDEKKGHSHNGSGDNNDSVNSGIKESEPVNEVPKDTLPKEEEQKTEQVVVKTE